MQYVLNEVCDLNYPNEALPLTCRMFLVPQHIRDYKASIHDLSHWAKFILGGTPRVIVSLETYGTK